jgi:hypothetical protein
MDFGGKADAIPLHNQAWNGAKAIAGEKKKKKKKKKNVFFFWRIKQSFHSGATNFKMKQGRVEKDKFSFSCNKVSLFRSVRQHEALYAAKKYPAWSRVVQRHTASRSTISR